MLQVVVARTKTPPAGVFAVDQVTTTSKTKNDAFELPTVVSKPAGCRDRKIENSTVSRKITAIALRVGTFCD